MKRPDDAVVIMLTLYDKTLKPSRTTVMPFNDFYYFRFRVAEMIVALVFAL